MSQLQVANLTFSSAGTTRIEMGAVAANTITIFAGGANVAVYHDSGLSVTGRANVSGDMSIAGNVYITGRANVSGDMSITGNVYSGQVANISMGLGYVPWVYTTGNTTLTWTGLAPVKLIRLKTGGVLPGATGAILRMYLSSDNGVNYGGAIQLGFASPNGNLVSHDIVVTNTSITGSKTIISRGGGATTATPIGYAQANTESVITGVINAVKMNSTGVIAFTTAAAGIGMVAIYGEV